jgi:hypothetical protein
MMFAVQTREGVVPNDALVDHMIKKIKPTQDWRDLH